MKIAIGRAYNGLHKIYKQELNKLGVKVFYFNIDQPNWRRVDNLKPKAYLWHADDKGVNYSYLYDRIYFIERILGKPVFPNMKMYFAQGDKIKQWQILNYLKIKTPQTYIIYQREIASQLIKKLKYPFILKNPYGYGGYQVLKVENLKQAQRYVDLLFNQKLKDKDNMRWPAVFFAQEFIVTRKDLRVVTLGDKIYCAYWRKDGHQSWKHNLEQGAEIDYNNLPTKALKLCQKISQRLGFHWMAYDLFVLDKQEILVNEYSCNFADKGIRQAGLNIRQAQMQYLKNFLN